jgi:hypothetical protein
MDVEKPPERANHGTEGEREGEREREREGNKRQ